MQWGVSLHVHVFTHAGGKTKKGKEILPRSSQPLPAPCRGAHAVPLPPMAPPPNPFPAFLWGFIKPPASGEVTYGTETLRRFDPRAYSAAMAKPAAILGGPGLAGRVGFLSSAEGLPRVRGQLQAVRAAQPPPEGGLREKLPSYRRRHRAAGWGLAGSLLW